jgi:hypothetical protein
MRLLWQQIVPTGSSFSDALKAEHDIFRSRWSRFVGDENTVSNNVRTVLFTEGYVGCNELFAH